MSLDVTSNMVDEGLGNSGRSDLPDHFGTWSWRSSGLKRQGSLGSSRSWEPEQLLKGLSEHQGLCLGLSHLSHGAPSACGIRGPLSRRLSLALLAGSSKGQAHRDS